MAANPYESPKAPAALPAERLQCPPWYRFIAPQFVIGAIVSVIAFGWLFTSFCAIEDGDADVRLPAAAIFLYDIFGKWPTSLALMIGVFAGIASEMRKARQKWLAEHGQK